MDSTYLMLPFGLGVVSGIRAGLTLKPMSLVRYGFVVLLVGLAFITICVLIDRFVVTMPLRKQILVATVYVGTAFLSSCITRGVDLLRRPARVQES